MRLHRLGLGLSLIVGLAACTGDPGAQGDQGPQGPGGTPGHVALVNTSAEPAGANCADGGTKIEAGVDTNDNGTLDAQVLDDTMSDHVRLRSRARGLSPPDLGQNVPARPRPAPWENASGAIVAVGVRGWRKCRNPSHTPYT